MFHVVVVDNKLSVGYVNEVSFVQNILESRESEKFAMNQVMSLRSPFEVQ